jgi:hypothetical protein
MISESSLLQADQVGNPNSSPNLTVILSESKDYTKTKVVFYQHFVLERSRDRVRLSAVDAFKGCHGTGIHKWTD